MMNETGPRTVPCGTSIITSKNRLFPRKLFRRFIVVCCKKDLKKLSKRNNNNANQPKHQL